MTKSKEHFIKEVNPTPKLKTTQTPRGADCVLPPGTSEPRHTAHLEDAVYHSRGDTSQTSFEDEIAAA